MSWMRLGLGVGLVLLGMGTMACSFTGDTVNGYTTARTPCEAMSDAGVGMGLVPPDQCGPCGAPSPLGAQYGQYLGQCQQTMAHHLFNYDVNDPYRGKDGGRIGEFVGTYLLNYDIHDPFRGDCVTGW